MFYIFVEDTFDAAHFLPYVEPSHKCHNVHGHTYRVRLEIQGKVNNQGWVMDYAEVRQIWVAVKERLDHHCINNIPELENPTAENIAQWIAIQLYLDLPGLSCVELRETEHCGVRYTIL